MTKQLITEEYRALNAELHGRNAKYGAKGHDWENRVVGYLKDLRRRMFVGSHLHDQNEMTYLDYGCGKGSLAAAISKRTAEWRGFTVHTYDPVTAPNDPPTCDFLSCCDVLEHIEPDLLDNVLEDIRAKTGELGLLVISQRLANKKLADGRNAHLIVESTPWWMERLAPFFSVIEVEPIKSTRKGIELAVLVTPKKTPTPEGAIGSYNE